MEEKNTNNDSEKHRHDEQAADRIPIHESLKQRWSLLEFILFLVAVVVTHYLDRDIITTILLIIALLLFHYFRTTRSRVLRFSFLASSILCLAWCCQRFYVTVKANREEQYVQKQQIIQSKDFTSSAAKFDSTKQIVPIDSAKAPAKKKHADSKTEQRKRDTATINITSYGQQGGQTGIITNQFNVSPPQRHVQVDSAFSELLSHAGFSYALHFNSDDKETVKFADNIAKCLSLAQWRRTTAVPHSQDWSLTDVVIETGSSPECDAASSALYRTLKRHNIAASISKNSSISDNFMYLRVWPMP